MARDWILIPSLLLGLCACSEQHPAPFETSMQTITNFALSETQRGIKQWVLRSEQASLQDAGDTELVNPHVDIYQDGKLSTQVQSKKGIYYDSSRNVHLQE